MAIPESFSDLWIEAPLQLKMERLDDLFEAEPCPELAVRSPTCLVNYKAGLMDGVGSSNLTPDEPMISSLEVVGSESSIVGGTFEPSKLYGSEDFHSFLAREGGIDRDRLSRLVDYVVPRPDEDFASFLARSNGIRDEQVINRLRMALRLESVFEYKSGMGDFPVKMETDQELKVGEGEDAASFFVRAGSWESSSSITDDLASVGLDEFCDEDAESFFRRTESISDIDHERDCSTAVEEYGSPSILVVSAKRDECPIMDHASAEAGGGFESDEQDRIDPKKRKSCDAE